MKWTGETVPFVSFLEMVVVLQLLAAMKMTRNPKFMPLTSVPMEQVESFDQPVGGAVQPIEHHHLDEGTHFMNMKGRDMFKVATRTLAGNAKVMLEESGYQKDDVDWLVPHQANIRIIETTAKLLDFPMEKVIVNIEKYGNTSAATVPMAFHEAIQEGKIKRGDLVMFDAFGAGLTTGATLLRY